MSQNRPVLFSGRHFEDVIILLCVRWYLRYSLSYRDLEEMMVERGLSIDHVTIWRWDQRYAPIGARGSIPPEARMPVQRQEPSYEHARRQRFTQNQRTPHTINAKDAASGTGVATKP